MGTTANKGYVWPEPGESAGSGDDVIRAFAEAVDGDVASLDQGLAAAVTPSVAVLTPTTGTATIDLAGADYLTHGPLTGNITYATAGRAAGRSAVVRIETGAAVRTFTFPAAWRWLSDTPVQQAANRIGLLSLVVLGGTAEANVIASYAEEVV